MSEEGFDGGSLWGYRIESPTRTFLVDIKPEFRGFADETGLTQERIADMARKSVLTVGPLFNVREEDLPVDRIEVTDFTQPRTMREAFEFSKPGIAEYRRKKRIVYDFGERSIRMNVPGLTSLYTRDPDSFLGDMQSMLDHEFGHAASVVYAPSSEHYATDQQRSLRTSFLLKELPAISAEFVSAKYSLEGITADPIQRLTFFKEIYANLSDYENPLHGYKEVYEPENQAFAYWLLRTYGPEKISRLQDRHYTTITDAFTAQYGRDFNLLLDEFAFAHLPGSEQVQARWLGDQDRTLDHLTRQHPRLKHSISRSMPLFYDQDTEDNEWITRLKQQHSMLFFRPVKVPQGSVGVVFSPESQQIFMGRWGKGVTPGARDGMHVDSVDFVKSVAFDGFNFS